MGGPNALRQPLKLGKIEGKRRGAANDEMFGWHQWLNGHEYEQTLGDRRGQGSLACYTVHGITKSQIQLSS